MQDIDLHCLKAFVSVAECGSVTMASSRLGRTQPAVSLQIQKLEQSLGASLFDRRGRRLVLNREGEVFLERARGVLELLSIARAELGAGVVKGTVVLGTPDLYAAHLLPRILQEFGGAYPQVQIELRCDLSVRLLQALARGELDLALVTRMPNAQGGHFVRREQLVWVGSAAHDTHKLAQLPLAMLPPGNLYRDLALEALERRGRPFFIAAVSESFAGLQAAALAGLAITAVSRGPLAPGLRHLGYADGLPDLPSVELVVHRRHGTPSQPMQALYRYLLEDAAAGRPASDPLLSAADATLA